jgi:hypothetical protein
MSVALKPAGGHSRPRRRAALDVLRGQRRAYVDRLGADNAQAPPLRVIHGPTRVLIAGPEADCRAKLLDELAKTLPTSIGFEETGSVCEALELAPTSRMAIITGDLGEVSAESLMHMLAQRHPTLPVMIVASPSRNRSERVAAHGSALCI